MMTTPAGGADLDEGDEAATLTRGFAAIAANPADVAEYVAEYTRGLSRLARASKLEVLAYLLDVAHLEAQTVLGKPKHRDG